MWQFYHEMWQLLQNATVIEKWEVHYNFKMDTAMTNLCICDDLYKSTNLLSYYKGCRLFASVWNF